MRKNMHELVTKLKENNQDFEFYPTSNEMLACIPKSAIYSAMGKRKSVVIFSNLQ